MEGIGGGGAGRSGVPLSGQVGRSSGAGMTLGLLRGGVSRATLPLLGMISACNRADRIEYAG
jgi:hypothetical protein